jgi:hypothetical protein
VKSHAEVDVHVEVVVEKAIELPVVKGLRAKNVRPGLEAGDHELSGLAEGEPAHQLPRLRAERHDMRALDPAAALGDAPADAAKLPREGRRAVDIGDARDVVGLERPIRDVAAAERDREHDGLRRDHAAAAADELCFAERGMREPQQVTDFVHGYRFDVKAIVAARLGRGPRECRIEEDVGFEDPAVGDVHREGGRGKRPVLVRAIYKPQHACAVVDKRLRLNEADELRRGLGRLDGVPRAEGPCDGRLKLLGRDLADAAVRDEVADREIAPSQTLRPAADGRPELQVSANRNDHAQGQGRDQQQRA